MKSNILGFGDEIGKTTNRVTSMFDVMSLYPPESEEYKTLEYRVMCGQLFQQNAIDKIKGIIAKPMPRNWFDIHAISTQYVGTAAECERTKLYRNIVADKKPYFMRYIYPTLLRDFKNYQREIDAKSMMQYGKRFEVLAATPDDELTEEQRYFVEYSRNHYPVSMNNCVMNRICRRFETEFDGILGRYKKDAAFDYEFLKTGHGYRKDIFYKVKKIYEEYSKWLRLFMMHSRERNIEQEEFMYSRDGALTSFMRQALSVCANIDELHDIMLDLCYKSDSGKQFVWDMCGDNIIDVLLKKNGGKVNYLILDPDGDIEYAGDRFSMVHTEVDAWET